jgi:hypothetical protein
MRDWVPWPCPSADTVPDVPTMSLRLQAAERKSLAEKGRLLNGVKKETGADLMLLVTQGNRTW